MYPFVPFFVFINACWFLLFCFVSVLFLFCFCMVSGIVFVNTESMSNCLYFCFGKSADVCFCFHIYSFTFHIQFLLIQWTCISVLHVSFAQPHSSVNYTVVLSLLKIWTRVLNCISIVQLHSLYLQYIHSEFCPGEFGLFNLSGI